MYGSADINPLFLISNFRTSLTYVGNYSRLVKNKSKIKFSVPVNLPELSKDSCLC